MKVADLAPNPKNPRTITDKKLTQLKKALAEFGDLGGLVFNRRTGMLVGGHQRAKLFPKDAEIKVTKSYDKPTKVGTVAEGFVLVRGERFKYREVDWDETREKAANIAANKGAGEWDLSALSDWMREIDDFGFDLDLTMFDEEERKALLDVDGSGPGGTGGDAADVYTKKIEAPIYEPRGEKPKLSELTNFEKTKSLLKKIEAAKVPEDVKAFLRAAAARHVVFDYENIAEYYAHAPKAVQELFEDSALVIIDFDKAIENGFVSMSKEIAEAYQSGDAN